jgi:hypothetical protein
MPSLATSAEIRFSNAAARGASPPPMLTPIKSKVDDRCDDGVPINAERQALAVNRSVLPRAVKGKNVVAALDTCACSFAVQFLSGSVKTRVHDEEWPLCVRFIDAVKVTRQSCVFISNLDGKDRRITERTTSFVGFKGFLVGAVYTRIVWIAVKEELGGTKICSRPQIAVSCAHAMARPFLSFSLGKDSRSRGIPFVVPTIGTVGGDALTVAITSPNSLAPKLLAPKARLVSYQN